MGANDAIEPDALDKELRSMGNVAEKITKLSEMLHQKGMDDFVRQSEWKDEVKKFTSLHIGSLATDFQQAVFWPRNEVLHQGRATHTEPEAATCYRLADLGIRILRDMDKAKCDEGDKAGWPPTAWSLHYA